jgi:hypothetical protein
MAATGAAALVLVVVGAFGLLGGGGPDLAAPDGATIDYVKLEYTSTINPVCEGGEIIDNGGFDEATIEIWGPNSDDLTLMVATFPDGSTERMMVEGDPGNPDYIWVEGNPEDYPSNTKLRVVQCAGVVGSPGLLDAFSPGSAGAIVPFHMLGPPPGFEGFAESFIPEQAPTPTQWNGNAVLLYEFRRDEEAGSNAIDLYVTEDDRRALRFHAEQSLPGVGDAVVDYSVVEEDVVPADTVSFLKSGLTAIAQVFGDLGAEDCPVTIPNRAFTPPDTHPATPSGSDMVWFGKDELWTALSTDGISEGRRSVWWSANFTDPGIEPSPDITVTYTPLNIATGQTIVNDGGTNASTPEDGLFIIAGSEPPIEGCWQVTAIYKDASLTYIYYNPDGFELSTGTVPDVVGMMVNEARSVLETLTFQAAFHDSANPTYEVCAQEPGAGLEISPGEIIGMRTAPLGGCEDLMDASLNPNALYDTYQDQFGNVWYQTSCPEADVLITGGEDGLPRLGQTWKDRVEQMIVVEEVQAELAEADFFLGNPGVFALSAVPRNGEVWDRDDNNDVVVTHVADYMIEATIDDESACPSAPVSWNGIPVAYIKSDTN